MRELKIKQLSKSGEIIGVVGCFSGKVNVLRAKTEDEILPYQRALINSVGPDNFELEVDGTGVDFNSDVVKIGFNNPTELNKSVKEYLKGFSSGFSFDALKAISRDFELDKELDTELSKLTESKIKLVEMLKLSLCDSKIFVIYLPFEKVDYNLREVLSDYMLEVCETQNHIIVITSLQYTPKNWVQNEMINRIEVGQNRHKTIGFGSAPSELQAMLKEVRKDNQKNTESANNDSFLDSPVTKSNKTKNKSFFLVSGFLIIFGVTYYFASDFLSKKNEIELVEDKSKLIVKEETVGPKKVIKKEKVYALNLLPNSIKKSIISTFNGSSESVSYREVKRKEREIPKKKVQESAGESLLQSLRRTSNTGKDIKSKPNIPRYVNRNSSTSSISEQRRELLRQKFKEALARASSRR